MESVVDHHILILDDQPHISFILKKFLEKQYNVLSATSIDEAESMLSDTRIEVSVAFVDYNLKDEIDGIDYAKQLRETYPLTQVIIITGASSYEVAIKALNSGVITALINKPFAFNDIQKTLNENLELWNSNYMLVQDQVKHLLKYGSIDEEKIENSNLATSHIKNVIKQRAALVVKHEIDILGFGVTKGDQILVKYFYDKTIQSKYTPLFAKFLQTVSNLNLDLFIEADNHKLEELTLEDVSILFRSVNKLNYSIFVKGEPVDKSDLTAKVNQITSELSKFTSVSNDTVSEPVKQKMIEHFQEFRESFSYQ